MAQKPGSLAPMHRNVTPVPLGPRGRFGAGPGGAGASGFLPPTKYAKKIGGREKIQERVEDKKESEDLLFVVLLLLLLRLLLFFLVKQ